jgi:hypothetical protein
VRVDPLYWLITLLLTLNLFSSCSTAQNRTEANVEPIKGNVGAQERADSYFTGCLGGIVAVHELKYRNELDNGPVGFGKLKAHCLGQAFDYFHFLNGEVTK